MRNIGGSVGSSTNKEPPQRKLFRRRTVNTNTAKHLDIQTIGAFKLIPSYTPSHFTTNRPLMGQCCKCMPLSQRAVKSTGLKELGMRNLFDVRNELTSSSVLSTLFPLETYTLQRPLFRTYPEVSGSVLSSPRVMNAIQSIAEQIIVGAEVKEDFRLRQLENVKKRCLKIINTMKASVSPIFISITAWFLTRFLARFVQSVQVCRGQMMMIRQSCEKEVPMIYLPLHRSHLDYILVTLILWHYDIRAPYVAAGDNMDIPIFNLLMRALGGFFIRRRLDSKKGEKDVLYRAVLNEYMCHLLREGESLEFFIEGGRTRTGRSVNPKGGLLSVVVDAYNQGEISDAYIVPVTFSYEKIIDGNYNREQMGVPKVKESFWGAMKAIFHVFFNSYGNVRVDFSQPFSLQEFLHHSTDNAYHPLTEERKASLAHRVSYPNFSQDLVPTEGEENVRMSVKALADHVVYCNDRCTPPMSTHLIAFLLLTKYRQGAYMKELVQAVHWMVRELQGIHVDVGFCGQAEDAILHAQDLLGVDLISRKWHAENNDIKLFPNLMLPHVFELSYYGNLVSTHFALESAVATAVLYESGLSFYHLQGSSPLEQIKVLREKVLETAEEICTILHSEYIFVPPCGNIGTSLMEVLENMISKEVLSMEDSQDNELMFEGKDRRWAERLAHSLDPDAEEDDGEYMRQQPLLVNVERSDIRERLHFLVSVIAPLLESYMLVGKFALEGLTVQEEEEEKFVKALGEYARERVSSGLAMFSESCAMITLKSAVKAFQDLDILHSYRASNLTIIGLGEEMGVRSKLENYVSLLQAAIS